MSVADVKRRVRHTTAHRRSVVAVIGSGVAADPHSAAIGQLIATLGFDLLTGGGRGVMEAVSRGFYETTPRRGIVIGVVPANVEGLESLENWTSASVMYDLPPGYPNEWVELAIYTHLPDSGVEGTLRSSRNHINVLSADAIVALPGREGTRSEMWLAIQYGVPIVAYGDHDKPTPDGLAHARSLDEVRAFLARTVPSSSA
jgi:predicted Rossmann-fold nucleotide-binding protein